MTGNASKSIIISNTVDIELQRLVIIISHCYGLSIENSFGNVLLHTLKFLNNRIALTGDEYTYGGGGLAVMFVMTHMASNLTDYNISNCTLIFTTTLEESMRQSTDMTVKILK